MVLGTKECIRHFKYITIVSEIKNSKTDTTVFTRAKNTGYGSVGLGCYIATYNKADDKDEGSAEDHGYYMPTYHRKFEVSSCESRLVRVC